MRRFVELMLLRRVGLERWVVILKRLLLDFSAGVYSDLYTFLATPISYPSIQS